MYCCDYLQTSGATVTRVTSRIHWLASVTSKCATRRSVCTSHLEQVALPQSCHVTVRLAWVATTARLLTTATESTARVTASAASSTAPATTVTARTAGSDSSAADSCVSMTSPAGMAAHARKCDVSTSQAAWKFCIRHSAESPQGTEWNVHTPKDAKHVYLRIKVWLSTKPAVYVQCLHTFS